MIDSSNRLVVADQRNARISIFGRDGTLLESHTSPISSSVTQISELPDDRFLLVGMHNDHLAHIVTPEFEDVVAHLIPVSDVQYTDEAIEAESLEVESAWLLRNPGHAVPLSEGGILYAPSIYGGELYVYEQDDENTWRRAAAIAGYPVDQPPLIISEDQEDAQFRAPGGTASHFHSFTSGLYALRDSGAIHVFSRETEDGVEFLAGLVSADATYEGYFSSELPANEDHFSLWTYAIDANDNIYLGNSAEYPLMRRMNILLEN